MKIRNLGAGAPRRPGSFACAALALALSACGGDSGDSAAAGLPPAGTAANPLQTVPDGGAQGGAEGGAADDPIGAGGGPLGGATDPGVAAGGGESFEFECGGDTIVAQAGDTVQCGGTTYEVDSAGNATPVGGGSGGGSSGGGGGGSVASDLLTAFVDSDNYDVWFCASSEASGFNVGYAFDASGVGAYFRFEPDGSFGNVGFDWEATGADSVLLTYENGAEDITGIRFSGANAWTGFSSTDGELSCERATVEVGG